MSVRPRVLGQRVLLKPLEAAEATATGIVLPDEVRGKESRGMVVDVGEPPAGEMEPPVARGDVVVYAEHGATPYSHPTRTTVDNAETGNAETLIVVDYCDLLLVLEEVPSEVPA